jgi:hypothetical protein
MPLQQATGLVEGEILPALRHLPSPQPQRPQVPEGWLTRPQAAARLGIGLRTLDLWRSLGWGPPAARVADPAAPGRRLCLYHERDIVSFRHLMLPRQRFRRVLLEGPGGRIFSRAAHQVKRTGQRRELSTLHPCATHPAAAQSGLQVSTEIPAGVTPATVSEKKRQGAGNRA